MKNKLKTFFWWMYSPADEREKELYNKAYSRAFFGIMIFLGLLLGVWFTGLPYYLYQELEDGLFFFLMGYIGMAGYLSLFAGWLALRKEEPSLKKTSANMVIGWIVAIAYLLFIFLPMFMWTYNYVVYGFNDFDIPESGDLTDRGEFDETHGGATFSLPHSWGDIAYGFVSLSDNGEMWLYLDDEEGEPITQESINLAERGFTDSQNAFVIDASYYQSSVDSSHWFYIVSAEKEILDTEYRPNDRTYLGSNRDYAYFYTVSDAVPQEELGFILQSLLLD